MMVTNNMKINHRNEIDKKTIHCYVCNKPIKQSQLFIYIGVNLNNLKMYRHKKCSSYNLSNKKLTEIKNWTKYLEVKEK